MCGIFGVVGKNGLSETALSLATGTLSHRGPNAQGLYIDKSHTYALGHRRLSILDLSDIANQPMYSSCGRYIMVYNGEVYNFNQLKVKLPGFKWKTSSDSEVVLELFAAFGAGSFALLNGMFSIAIFDSETRALTIARDQVGIKPLFYYQDAQQLVFASEIKAIRSYLNSQGRQLGINRQAIPGFLHLGFIPEPATIYQDIYKFPAGYHGMVSSGHSELKLTKFWDAEEFLLTDPVKDEKDALTRYKELLFASVDDQMVSDVPLGTFLSGGIDSSLVTAVAAQISSHKINTFSIGFKEPKFDESQYAQTVADHLGTDHHTFKVSVDEVMELVPSLMKAYDEPFADSSAFPTLLVSKLARQHVTVALSGDGGDELFQGYGMYTWAKRLNNPLVQTIRKPLYYAGSALPDRYKRAARLFNYPNKENIPTHIFSQEQYYFSEQELKSLLVSDDVDFEDLNALPNSKTADVADLQAFWDLEHYLKDDLLVKVDRASMAYSLETRVPLLDRRLVEFALNVDSSLKTRADYGAKYLMKRVLYELVPRELFERPKRGFAIPLPQWLKGSLSWMIEDYLNAGIVERHAIVHFSVVKSIVEKFRSGQNHLYNRIWTLIVLHWWFEDN